MNAVQKESKLLSDLKKGDQAEIVNFVDDGPLSQRLAEMGVTPGEKVEIIRFAPLGDPIEIKIRGYNLSLRKEEADLIKVSMS